jgi:transcriptional regulator with XRE-family HTH domain
MISAAQCRAARSLLNWSQQKLADEAGVGVVTIRQLEAGTHQPRQATLQVVRHRLEAAGVRFIDENGGGAGVRFQEPERRER